MSLQTRARWLTPRMSNSRLTGVVMEALLRAASAASSSSYPTRRPRPHDDKLSMRWPGPGETWPANKRSMSLCTRRRPDQDHDRAGPHADPLQGVGERDHPTPTPATHDGTYRAVELGALPVSAAHACSSFLNSA